MLRLFTGWYVSKPDRPHDSRPNDNVTKGKTITLCHPEVLHSLIKMGLMNTPQMHEFVTADPDLAFEMLHNKTFLKMKCLKEQMK